MKIEHQAALEGTILRASPFDEDMKGIVSEMWDIQAELRGADDPAPLRAVYAERKRSLGQLMAARRAYLDNHPQEQSE